MGTGYSSRPIASMRASLVHMVASSMMEPKDGADKILETERLVLRQMTMDDVDALMDIFSDPEAMRYYPSTKSRDEAEGWVRWVQHSYEENGFGLWAAILMETGEFTGQCGLMPQQVEGHREVEIGYLFLRRFWGRGLATEAAYAARSYGFRRLGLDRLVSLIDPANVPSKRVAERVGMEFEKQVNWHGKRICLFSITSWKTD